MRSKQWDVPKFKSESDEADWWASAAGRAYVKRKSAEAQSKGATGAGSALVANLSRQKTIQIAIRLAESDVAQARQIAERKGIGYQTLLKMIVHEGLAREVSRRHG